MPNYHHHLRDEIYPTPTLPLLYERSSSKSSDASESSSSSSDYCDESPNASMCQKPVSNNALTIALSIVLPCIAIFCVLGFFLYRNYRKDKKEGLEHEPDFYETGEATALPDYPDSKGAYGHEDPFHNRNSVRYPMDQINQDSMPFNDDGRGKGYYKQNHHHHNHNHNQVSRDPYLDSFVLPYQHQTGSKLSIDDYAKNLGDSQGYRTPNDLQSRTRTNSMTLDKATEAVGVAGGVTATATATTTANANTAGSSTGVVGASSYTHSRKPSSLISPTKKVQGKQYTGVPDEHDHEEVGSANPEVSTVMESSDDSGINSPHDKDAFGIEYENESNMAINNTIPQIVVHDESASEHENEDTQESRPTSPFDDEDDMERNPQTMDTIVTSVPEDSHKTNVHYSEKEDQDGEFNFSNQYEAQSKDTPSESITNSSDGDKLRVAEKPISKSPRISAFNLLKNDSDDEGEAEDDEEMDALSPQQQEELRRMKSVYKVYFDREVVSGDHSNFEAEEDQSLPVDNVNSHMQVDTSYGNRYSTGSSVYVDPEQLEPSDEQQQQQQQQQQQYQQQQQHYYDQFNQQYQQQFGSPVDPQLYRQIQQQQYHYYQQQQMQMQQRRQQQQPQRPLPPLQQLRHPSDLRKSTIQTFTDFKPRHKNQNVTSPPMGKQPFVPIESDGVWTSPISSPAMQSQASFQSHQQQQQNHQQSQNGQQDYFSQQNYAPQQQQMHHQQQQQQQQQQQPHVKAVPSATQLSRSSVVMLNPVTEITKSRKFKPAGSYPSNANLHAQFGHGDLNGPENDLLPGNRKSDVRRMMNSNF